METKQLIIGVTMCLAAMALLSGCAKPNRLDERQVRRSSHLVYNPSSTHIALADTPRANWPSTLVYQGYDQEISYQETILDSQGRSGFGLGSQDQYYRRFQSTRTGHGKR